MRVPTTDMLAGLLGAEVLPSPAMLQGIAALPACTACKQCPVHCCKVRSACAYESQQPSIATTVQCAGAADMRACRSRVHAAAQHAQPATSPGSSGGEHASCSATATAGCKPLGLPCHCQVPASALFLAWHAAVALALFLAWACHLAMDCLCGPPCSWSLWLPKAWGALALLLPCAPAMWKGVWCAWLLLLRCPLRCGAAAPPRLRHLSICRCW